MFGVETTPWSTASKKAGKGYRGIRDAAEQFMVRWNEDEAQLSRQRRASTVNGAQGNGGRGGQKKEGLKGYNRLGNRSISYPICQVGNSFSQVVVEVTRPRECGEWGQQED